MSEAFLDNAKTLFHLGIVRYSNFDSRKDYSSRLLIQLSDFI